MLTNNFRLVSRTFSSAIKKKQPEFLQKYKILLEKSAFISEELCPKKMNNSQELMKSFRISDLSPNVTVKGNVSVQSFNGGILDPCWDMLNRGGKKWRPIFGLIIAKYFKFDIEDVENNKLLYKLTELPELVHNASLIIDDVEDQSQMRRGQPCVHLKFGEDIAINAGIMMLFMPVWQLFNSIKDEKMKMNLTKHYLDEMIAIHTGQGWDIEMTKSDRIPLPSNYIDTNLFKTGVCPRLTVKMIKTLVNNSNYDAIFKEFIDVADYMSIAFQIKDDLLNLEQSDLAKGKGGVGEDITAGKLTLMVLNTLNSDKPDSKKERLREILLMKTKSPTLIQEAIDILTSNGSIDYAAQLMNHYAGLFNEKCNYLSQVDPKAFNGEATKELIGLMNYLIDRDI